MGTNLRELRRGDTSEREPPREGALQAEHLAVCSQVPVAPGGRLSPGLEQARPAQPRPWTVPAKQDGLFWSSKREPLKGSCQEGDRGSGGVWRRLGVLVRKLMLPQSR